MTPYLLAALLLLVAALVASWLLVARPRARRRAARRSVAEARLAQLTARRIRPDVADGLRYRGVNR